jgi:HlyD family secretion protein
MENLQRELERVKKLREDGAATEKQQDDLEGNIALVQAQINVQETQRATIAAERKSLQVQSEQLNEQISRMIVTNPSPGVVLQKYKQEGEIVAPGQILYKIAPLDRLILRAYISGSQLSQAKIGKEVTVRFDGSGGIEALPGTVTWIASEAEFTPRIIQTREERVNLVYAMKVEVKNDGRLKIGMPGEVKF